MISIRHIEYQNGKITVRWAKSSHVAEDDCFSLSSFEEPLSAFKKGFENLRARLIEELDLPEEWRDSITVLIVAMKPKAGFRFVQIVAEREIERTGQEMSIKMPDKPDPESPIGKAKPESALSIETMNAIQDLEAEAAKFISGERAQGELFESKDEQ